MNSRYGSLFQIDSVADAGSARRLDRVPLNGTKSDGGYDEAWLLKWTRAMGPGAKLEIGRFVMIDGAEHEQDETED